MVIEQIRLRFMSKKLPTLEELQEQSRIRHNYIPKKKRKYTPRKKPMENITRMIIWERVQKYAK